MAKLIAFDLVGTLIKSKIFADARSNILVDLDFNRGWREAESAAGFISYHFDYEVVFRFLLGNAPVKPIYRQFQRFLIDHTLDNAYLYPEVVRTMQQLHESGTNLGFVTDGCDEVEGEMIKAILRRSEIEPDRCIIVTGERVKSNKAQGHLFKELVEEAGSLGIARENIIFVGDNPEIDVKGAKMAGLMTVLVSRLPETKTAETNEPDLQISGLEELLNLVKR